MKVIKWETLYHEDHGATLKHKCGKRIVTLYLLSFFIGPSFIFLAYFFRPESHPNLWGNHSLHHPFLTWDNALIMKIVTLSFTYNSRITSRYLEQHMTLHECLWRCTGMCNESRVTCMKELWTVALPQIRCQLHDHAKQYDNDGTCHNKRNGGKLHGNISRNGYGNAIIGSYGGCFEEGIWWVYGTGESCTILERVAMVEGWECV